MKKLLSVVLCFSMIFALCVPAFAVETDQENMSQEFSAVDEFLTTNEDAMPPVPDFSVQTTNPVSTLNMPSRAAWVKNTTETLESAYSQSVVDVSETKDFIVFTFEEPEEIYNDFGYIDRVEYVKPESTAATEYETKITYMYGWLDGYYPLEEQSGKWSAVKDLLLTVAGFSEKLSVYLFVVDVLGIAYNYFKGPDVVKASNTTQYYVLNKIGQVKHEITGLWLQWAYVGSRRSFYRTLIEKEVSQNYWNTVDFTETRANNVKNPTNADNVEKKANFDNDTWIAEKAVSAYLKERAFKDVYGWTVYFSETIPH